MRSLIRSVDHNRGAAGLKGGFEGVCPFDLDLSFKNAIAARREEGLKVRPPKQTLATRPLGVGIMQFTRPVWSQTWMPIRVAT